MIQKFIDAFVNNKAELLEEFEENEPQEYSHIVSAVVRLLHRHIDEWNGQPDPNRITPIRYGDYQGTYLFVVATTDYSPSQFYATLVNYGSCSGCDALQRVRSKGSVDWPEEDTSEDKQSRIAGYMTLALHIVEGFKEITN